MGDVFEVRFSHASLAACGELLRVALSAALVRSATDVASSATFPFRMAYSSAKGPALALAQSPPRLALVHRSIVVHAGPPTPQNRRPMNE
eukprot:scaffold78461_cov30-Tisochrysis_lutea.AAC.4